MEQGKRFIGMFHTEQELLARVNELKIEGYADSQIFVLAKSGDDVRMLQRRTDAEIVTTNESWLDKFMDFMTGEDRVRNLMDELGFSDNERAGFYQEVNDGSMLLYVEENQDMPGQPQEVGRRFYADETAGNPAPAADTWVEPPGGGVTRTPEQPPFGEPAVQPAHETADSVKKVQPLERSEFSAAADDTITNALETTDFAGELGRDPEEEAQRKKFQESVNNQSDAEEAGRHDRLKGDFSNRKPEAGDFNL